MTENVVSKVNLMVMVNSFMLLGADWMVSGKMARLHQVV
jgi:hypothetical protein